MKKIYYWLIEIAKGLINIVIILFSDPHNIENNWNNIKWRDKKVLIRFTIIFFTILAILLTRFDVRLVRI